MGLNDSIQWEKVEKVHSGGATEIINRGEKERPRQKTERSRGIQQAIELLKTKKKMCLEGRSGLQGQM